ncbi:hypothetical protein DMC30DRAFT_302976 [Rhodotorula diobovata]|uniref:Uncharacterized protein n=1 Tax=Rhodotorula diobovata TaxID=5288 RepID=A0A5C5FRF2_9BASI|nr:hypothetical protein DMC30DRAFT_302976 [Rhodotorula diobovata]
MPVSLPGACAESRSRSSGDRSGSRAGSRPKRSGRARGPRYSAARRRSAASRGRATRRLPSSLPTSRRRFPTSSTRRSSALVLRTALPRRPFLPSVLQQLDFVQMCRQERAGRPCDQRHERRPSSSPALRSASRCCRTSLAARRTCRHVRISRPSLPRRPSERRRQGVASAAEPFVVVLPRLLLRRAVDDARIAEGGQTVEGACMARAARILRGSGRDVWIGRVSLEIWACARELKAAR